MKKSLGMLALCCALLALGPASLLALEAADHDAFFIGGGSSNVEVKGSNALLDGTNIAGGVRIGLFSIFFAELGYGTIGYFNTVNLAGTPTRVSYRTTGPNYGGGIAFSIRQMRLGVRMNQSFNNRWQQRRVDDNTGVEIDNISGRIDFNSYFVFTQFGEGVWEIGIRRDQFQENTSQVTNSFGPYITVNLLTGK